MKNDNKTKVNIHGYSDDIVSIDGAIKTEFYPRRTGYLFFSNGVVVSCEYDEEGVWRFSILKTPEELEACEYPAGTTVAGELADADHTDVITFDTGEVPDWVTIAYQPPGEDIEFRSGGGL